MDWWVWLLSGVALVVVLAFVALRLLRATRRGRRFLTLSLRGKLRFGRALLGDPEVPLSARILLILLVAYLALPFDVIPDFIPVLGQLDDALVVAATIFLLFALVPRDRFEAALAVAEADQAARARPADDSRMPSVPPSK